jgi:hypothetical protein
MTDNEWQTLHKKDSMTFHEAKAVHLRYTYLIIVIRLNF